MLMRFDWTVCSLPGAGLLDLLPLLTLVSWNVPLSFLRASLIQDSVGMGLGLPALLFPWVALVIGSCSAAWLSLPRVSSVGAHVAFLLMEGASVSWLRSAIHCEASLYFSGMLGVFLSSRWEPVHFLLVPEVGQRPSPQRGP